MTIDTNAIKTQLNECHPNDLVEALYAHGLVQSGQKYQASNMVAQDREGVEKMLLAAITSGE